MVTCQRRGVLWYRCLIPLHWVVRLSLLRYQLQWRKKKRAVTTIAGGSLTDRNLTQSSVQWSKGYISHQLSDPHISYRRHSCRDRSHRIPWGPRSDATYLPESFQVALRRRRPHQHGHLNKVRDRELCHSPRQQENYHETVETFRLWDRSRDRSKVGPHVGVAPQRKVFRRRGRVCRFQNPGGSGSHEHAGISKGVKEVPRAVQACRGWHRLNPAKSRLPLPL